MMILVRFYPSIYKIIMTSRWEGVPLDIIRQQFDYLKDPDDIQAFCEDPRA